MTIDMLATAILWPEEMLIGRPRIGDDPASDASEDTSGKPRAVPDIEPFWAALMRRWRADPASPGPERG